LLPQAVTNVLLPLRKPCYLQEPEDR
jgi:hypothetical protein